MGISFAASTPQVPDIDTGMYDAILIRVDTTFMEGGQFGEGFVTTDPDTGQKVNRFRWVYTLLDEEGATLYDDDGDPLEVDQLTGLQFFAKAKNLSKQTRAMKALLTPAEFEAWADGGEAPEVVGRKVQVEIGTNPKGYPTISNVLAPRKARRAARAVTSEDEA